MIAQPRKRRSPGEGGCWPYQTRTGERFRAAGPVLMADGTAKMVRKRGFLTRKDGQSWLSDQQSAGRKGEYVEPSRQRLGAYGAEVIDGLRIGPQAKASYKKNWRNHIEPYPLAHLPLAQLTGRRPTAKGEGLSARTVRYLHTIIRRVLGQAAKDGLLIGNAAAADWASDR